VTIRTCDRFWHQQRFPTLRCTALVPHLLWRGLASRRADLAKKRFIVGQVFTFGGLSSCFGIVALQVRVCVSGNQGHRL